MCDEQALFTQFLTRQLEYIGAIIKQLYFLRCSYIGHGKKQHIQQEGRRKEDGMSIKYEALSIEYRRRNNKGKINIRDKSRDQFRGMSRMMRDLEVILMVKKIHMKR